MESTQIREPWNKGKLVGQKRPLKSKHIWENRVAAFWRHVARVLSAGSCSSTRSSWLSAGNLHHLDRPAKLSGDRWRPRNDPSRSGVLRRPCGKGDVQCEASKERTPKLRVKRSRPSRARGFRGAEPSHTKLQQERSVPCAHEIRIGIRRESAAAANARPQLPRSRSRCVYSRPTLSPHSALRIASTNNPKRSKIGIPTRLCASIRLPSRRRRRTSPPTTS